MHAFALPLSSRPLPCWWFMTITTKSTTLPRPSSSGAVPNLTGKGATVSRRRLWEILPRARTEQRRWSRPGLIQWRSAISILPPQILAQFPTWKLRRSLRIPALLWIESGKCHSRCFPSPAGQGATREPLRPSNPGPRTKRAKRCRKKANRQPDVRSPCRPLPPSHIRCLSSPK